MNSLQNPDAVHGNHQKDIMLGGIQIQGQEEISTCGNSKRAFAERMLRSLLLI